MRRLCGLVLFKVGLGGLGFVFSLFFIFLCVFTYQGHQANLFIYYVEKRGGS